MRTLHHYDAIGVVGASERTASGHRRYTEADLRRLYRVRALRQLGLSLAEIGAVLDRSADDLASLRDLLAAQLADLEIQAARVGELRDQVRGLLSRLDGPDPPDPARFMSTLETISLLDAYLSREQRDSLALRRVELGEQNIEALRAELVGLLHELRRCQADGRPPEDPAVRALADRWERIGAAFHTGDQRTDAPVMAAVDSLWRDNQDQISEQIGRGIGWDGTTVAAVIDYVRRARENRPQIREETR